MMTWFRTPLQLPAEKIGKRWCFASIWHMNDVHPSQHLEQLGGHVHRSSAATRAKVYLAGIGLGIRNKRGNGLRLKGGIYQHDIRYAHDTRDGRDISDEIEIELLV